MNVKPLILAAALGLALTAHAAPKAASKGMPVKTQKAAKQAAAATPADSGAVRLSDGIAAIADNEVITRRRLAQAVADAKANLPKGVQISDTALTEQVLMQLVNQSLIVQAGKRRKACWNAAPTCARRRLKSTPMPPNSPVPKPICCRASPSALWVRADASVWTATVR